MPSLSATYPTSAMETTSRIPPLPSSSPTLSITQTVTGATGALLNGDHAGALTLLQSALTNAKSGLATPQNSTHLLQEMRRGMPFQLYALTLELDECESSISSTCCPGSLFTFYNAAVICEEICAEAEVFFSAELSAMILYNLGLVYHRSALMTGCSSYFLKALKLYDVAASIVLPPASEFLFTHDMTVLQLALYVNMGHIYSTFLEQDGTTRCAIGISNLFNAVDVSKLSPDTRNLFYKNMFVTDSQHHFRLAPAA